MMGDWTFENLVEHIPLPKLPGNAKPGFYGPLWDDSTGRNRWRLMSGVWRVYESGEVDLCPPGFSCDKRSGNFLTHAFFPRSIGKQDRSFWFHDLISRIHEIIGRPMRQVDMVEFREMLLCEGKPRWSAWKQSRSVYLLYKAGGRSRGDGWHGAAGEGDEYDTPVYDHEDRMWKPLALWARQHYRGDGTGYQCMRSLNAE